MSKTKTNTNPAPVENTTPTAVPAIILDNGMTVPAAFNFKSAALVKSAEVIAKAAIDMGKNAKTVAAELGRISTTKSYEEDGYKSVADFAEKVFNVGRSQAYAWAEVGARFLNSEESANKTVAALPLANAAVVVALSDEEIKAGVESGAITQNSTQSELKAYRDKVKAERPADPEKPKVLNMYEFVAFFGNRAFSSTTSMIEADISGAVASAVGYSTIIEEVKLSDIKSESKGTPPTKRRLYLFDDNGNPAPVMVEYRMVKAPTKTTTKSGTKSIHDLTAAELAELLKIAREREAAQEVEG